MRRRISMDANRPIHINDETFENEVIKSKVPVLVDFWAPWCEPCKAATPVLEKVAGDYKGKLKICKLNVDDQRQTAMKYGIMSIPTMNIFKNGQVVNRITGVTPNFESDLKKKIEPHLA
jgi:thioredoxin 1